MGWKDTIQPDTGSWKDTVVDDPKAPPPEESLGRRLTRATIDTVLPAGGAIGAGLIATPESAGLATVPAAAVGYAGGKQAARLLNHYLLGDDAGAQDLSGLAKQTAGDLGEGATAEVGGQALGAAAPYAGKALSNFAENAALNATGATAAQAQKFAPGTGRALLDNGIVKFGQSQRGVADAAQNALDATGSKIGQIIDELTAKGATGSKADLVAGIQSKIDQLGSDPAQAQVVKQLEGIKADVSAGPDGPSLRQIEDTKRGFQGMVNYANPEGNAAKAAAADVYKNAGENVVSQADPASAGAFGDAKTLYGQLSPVAAAGAKRTAQLNQASPAGLTDMVSYGVGGVPGVIAKKAILPRVSSSAAVTADKVSQMLLKSPEMSALSQRSPQAFQAAVTAMTNRMAPQSASAMPAAAKSELDNDSSTPASYQDSASRGANNLPEIVAKSPEIFGKFGPVLQNAASRGPQGVAATNFILQQTNPEYREALKKAMGDPEAE